MAGNVIATLPLIVFFIVAQKQFLAKTTFSGVKDGPSRHWPPSPRGSVGHSR